MPRFGSVPTSWRETPALTAFFLGGIDGVKLADIGNQADIRLDAVPGVVTRGAGYFLLHGGFQAVLVEQARDPRGGHAANTDMNRSGTSGWWVIRIVLW